MVVAIIFPFFFDYVVKFEVLKPALESLVNRSVSSFEAFWVAKNSF